MIHGIRNYKILCFFVLSIAFGCGNLKKCEKVSHLYQVRQYHKNLGERIIKEDTLLRDIIDLDYFEMSIIFVTQKEFDDALKNSCNYRSFSRKNGHYHRFNEFGNENIHRISEDSLFFKKENNYLVDGLDKTGFICPNNCNVKYFLQENIGHFYLIKVFAQESGFSLLFTDSLSLYKPLSLSLLPFQTIYDNQRKLFFSTESFRRFPKTNEITFYKWKNKKIKPILRTKLHERKLISPFFYKDELYFIYVKNKDSYYAKVKIPSNKQFNQVKEVPREIVLDSTAFILPPK